MRVECTRGGTLRRGAVTVRSLSLRLVKERAMRAVRMMAVLSGACQIGFSLRGRARGNLSFFAGFSPALSGHFL